MTQQAATIYAVCFDLDGVIVDTADWPKIICTQIADEWGITGQELWNEIRDRGANQNQVADIFCEHATGKSREEFLERCNEIDADMVAASIKLREGIEPVIRILEKNGILIGICTNGLFTPATDRLKTAHLDGIDISSRVRFIVSEADFGEEAKPSTRPLILSVGRIQEEWVKVNGPQSPFIEPENILVIGDTDKDIIPAAALNMPSIHWPYPGKEGHEDATHVVNNPDELLKAVTGYTYERLLG